MQQRLRAWVIGGLNVFIQIDVECINLETASFSVIGGLIILLKML